MAAPAAVLSILVTANTTAAKAGLSDVQKHLGRTDSAADKSQRRFSALQKTMGAVGLVAGGALVAGVKAGWSEMQEAARVGAQTNAVLKSTKGIANVTAKEIDRLSNSLMRKSGVDDETIQSGQNMLLTFTRVRNEVGKGNDIFTQATKATLDMSIAMGMPMTKAAIMVGKALQDPVKGVTNLRRVGVMLTESQTELVKKLVSSGRTMDAQRIILRELNTEFGGSAEAAGKTLPGRLNILKETFNNLAGSLMTTAAPALGRIAEGLTRFIQQIQSGKGAGGEFARVISQAFNIAKSVIGGFINLVGGLGNAVKIIMGLVAAFTALRVITSIVAGVQALKGAWAALNAVWAASPIGRLITVVTVLAGAFLALFGRQHSAAVSAREVAGAWDQANAAADRLANANIGLAQAKLDIINAQKNEKTTQQALNQAVAQYGPKSEQAKQADLAHKQAVLDLRSAKQRLTSATHEQTAAQHESTQATENAKVKEADRLRGLQRTVDEDRKAVTELRNMRDRFRELEPHSQRARDAQKRLDDATAKLNEDQRKLNEAIRTMPGTKASKVQIKIDYLSDVPGAVAGIAKWIAQNLAVGGVVNRPMAIVGEQAPRHPEVVLATNPAYRQRNLGLWAQAGQMLGVPGFQAGGITNAGRMVRGIDPWTASVAGQYGKRGATSWMKGVIGKIMGGASTGAGGGPVPPGSLRDWLTTALKITGYFSAANLAALYGRAMQESGGNPHAINLWDINAQMGHPSKGLLQTIDSTFAAYMMPGHGDIWNPVDNAIAAIRYMMSRYGHIVGPSATGYAKGGIIGQIPGFQTGGFNGSSATMAHAIAAGVPGYAAGGIVNVGPWGSVTVNIPTSPTKPKKWHPKALGVLGSMDPGITAAVSQINAIYGENGQIAVLQEQIATRESWFQTMFPTNEIIWTPPPTADAEGNLTYPPPVVDQKVVDRLVAYANDRRKWYEQMIALYDQVLAIIQQALQTISQGVKDRQQKINTLAGHIRTNIGKIKDAREAIRALNQIVPPPGHKQEWERLKNAAIANWNRLIGGWQTQNKAWGGFPEKVPRIAYGAGATSDAGGQIKTLLDVINNQDPAGLLTTQATMSADRIAIQGLTGQAGARLTAQQALWKIINEEQAGLTPAAIEAALAAAKAAQPSTMDGGGGGGGGGGGEGGPAGPTAGEQESMAALQKMNQLLQQQLAATRQAFAVSQAQYGVFANTTIPIAGAFAAGGIVSRHGLSLVGERGPEAVRLPIGSRVYNANQTSQMGAPIEVQIVVLDGAVDASRIQVIANGEAQKVLRRDTRRGVRGLPGAGGG